MSIKHEWLPHGLHIRYLDFVCGDSLLAAALEVSGDERFDDLRYIIGDWSGCTEAVVSTEEVATLAAYVKAIARSNSRIINLNVMRKDFGNQAFINLYMVLTDDVPWQVLAFRSLTEAESWLTEHL
tara:strand:- start:1474 stop:1851 length:378 start_codon:yes stop_codon:yes gene_type:complete